LKKTGCKPTLPERRGSLGRSRFPPSENAGLKGSSKANENFSNSSARPLSLLTVRVRFVRRVTILLLSLLLRGPLAPVFFGTYGSLKAFARAAPRPV
jgi:hypothetical protein